MQTSLGNVVTTTTEHKSISGFGWVRVESRITFHIIEKASSYVVLVSCWNKRKSSEWRTFRLSRREQIVTTNHVEGLKRTAFDVNFFGAEIYLGSERFACRRRYQYSDIHGEYPKAINYIYDRNFTSCEQSLFAEFSVRKFWCASELSSLSDNYKPLRLKLCIFVGFVLLLKQLIPCEGLLCLESS